jgi:hypothetical protein
MSQQSENLPLSRDQVLDEVEFLLTVEHALIVEYLSVCCALGHDLAAADGGPTTQSSRDAATAANALADGQMLRVGQLVRALSGLRTTSALGRAREIVDATGTEIPLGPPTREQLEHLLEREESIAAAVDARYARLGPAMAAGGPEEEAFPDNLRAAVEQGIHHADAVSVLRDLLADQPIADLLRATRRFGGTDAEKALLRSSDRTYALLLGALGNFYGNLDGDLSGEFRLMALGAMDSMNDINRALVHAGLLPPFQMPQA